MFGFRSRLKRTLDILPVSWCARADAFAVQAREMRRSLPVTFSGIQRFEPQLFAFWTYSLVIRNAAFSQGDNERLMAGLATCVSAFFAADFQASGRAPGGLSAADRAAVPLLDAAMRSRIIEYDQAFNRDKTRAWDDGDGIGFVRDQCHTFAGHYVGEQHADRFIRWNTPALHALCAQMMMAASSDLGVKPG